MTIIVEDGSGVDGANSPVTVAEADAFYGSQGNFSWDSAENKEAAIIRATAYVDSRYTWRGRRTYGRDQFLAWPRTGVSDNDGFALGDDEMPREYKNAVIIAALMVSLGSLDLTTDADVFVTSEQIGPLKTTYERVSNSSITQVGVKFPDFLDAIVSGISESRSATMFLTRV